MTVSKNFVVKNGLEVNTDLILADTTKSSVGIATTSPDYTLHVNGGIGATHLNVTGVATAVQIDATTLGADTGHIVTGVVTTISGTTLTYTNINGTTFDGSNVNADNLYAVSGIVTNITGTASTFTSSEISTLNAASANLVSGVATNFTVSGVTTLGVTTATSLEIGPINTISVNSGIITATSGVVTYYGDGQYLTNIQSGVGIRTAGAIVGYGATFLDFRGAGVSTITAPVSGIATINITGGGGGGSISVSTEAPSGAASGDLWYSPDRARTFIYYDESAVGYGTSKQWIDASPFNVGVLTQTSLTVPELTITGNVNTSGIITAATFSGNLTGNVTGNLTGTATTATNATSLETARNINGTAFDGTANITVEPYVEDDESATTSKFLTFVDSSTAAFQRLNEDSGLSYIPSLGALTVGSVRSYESLVGTASSTRIDYTVTVATKTANHRYIGQGSSSAYVLDDIESPFLTLLPGKTYRFDQADGTNSGHPLRFYLEADKTTAYTTDVTTNGTPGSSGAYTQILVTASTPQVLYYQCSSHGYMGNALSANSNIAGGLTGTPDIDVGTGSFTGDVDIADKIIHTGDTDTAIRFPAADTFSVETGGSEALRVNSDQKLLVGSTSSRDNFFDSSHSSNIQVEGNTTTKSSLAVIRNDNGSDGSRIFFAKSRGTGDTIVQDDDRIGAIEFQGNDGGGFVAAAHIASFVDGTPGSNDMPARLVFSTTADGASSPTERLRVDSSGLIGINTTPGTLLELKGESSKEATITFNRQPVQGTNDGVIGEFLFENATDSVALLAVKRESAADDAYFQFATQASGGGMTERLRIDSSGRLGIGTVTPQRDLHIHNGDSSTNAYFQITSGTTGVSNTDGFQLWVYGGSSNTNAVIAQRENADIEIWTNNTEQIRIDSSGRLMLGTTTEGANNADNFTIGDSSNGGMTIRSATDGYGNFFFSDATSGAGEYAGYMSYEHSSDSLYFGAGGAERFRIGSSGQIGLSGTNYGTSGQVLTSNGSSSAPTWQDTGTPTIASQAEAEAGTNNTNMMTPLRVKQAIDALGGSVIQSIQRGTFSPSSGTSGSVTITSVTTSKTMVNNTGTTAATAQALDQSAPQYYFHTIQLASSTSLTFTRISGTTAAAYNNSVVSYEVIEFK